MYPVRDIILEDNTFKIRVALLRNHSNNTVKMGDFVKISNCHVGEFEGQVQLSTTVTYQK